MRKVVCVMQIKHVTSGADNHPQAELSLQNTAFDKCLILPTFDPSFQNKSSSAKVIMYYFSEHFCKIIQKNKKIKINNDIFIHSILILAYASKYTECGKITAKCNSLTVAVLPEFWPQNPVLSFSYGCEIITKGSIHIKNKTKNIFSRTKGSMSYRDHQTYTSQIHKTSHKIYCQMYNNSTTGRVWCECGIEEQILHTLYGLHNKK